MNWVKAQCELWTDPRTIRLSIKLGVNRHEAAAIILHFRQWAAFTIKQEELTDILPSECAEGISFDGDADLLWESLQASNHIIIRRSKPFVADWDTDIVPVLNELQRGRKKSKTHYTKNKSEANTTQLDNLLPNRLDTLLANRTEEKRERLEQIEKKERPAAKPSKKKYGELENVTLLEDEYTKLLTEFGESLTSKKIQALSLYKGSTGKKYQSDYLTILAWDRRDKESGKGEQSNESGAAFEALMANKKPKEEPALL